MNGVAAVAVVSPPIEVEEAKPLAAQEELEYTQESPDTFDDVTDGNMDATAATSINIVEDALEPAAKAHAAAAEAKGCAPPSIKRNGGRRAATGYIGSTRGG